MRISPSAPRSRAHRRPRPVAACLIALVVPLSLTPLAASAGGSDEGKALTGPLRPEQIPEPLRPWREWVLRGHERAACPILVGGNPSEEADAANDEDEQAGGNRRACVWPGRLELQLDGKGGRFALSARLFREGFLPLPGDGERWPQSVKADGQPAVVVEHDGRPALWLKAGEHALAGEFSWSELPESIPVPVEIGLVSLSLRGRTVASPNREEDGLLWLQREEAEEAGESRLEIKVHRRLTDGVPVPEGQGRE
jgi:hypothetical protein